MRVAVFVLGLVGGIFALMGSFIALTLFGAVNAAEQKNGDVYAGRSASAMLCAVFILIFASLAFAGKKPRVMGLLLAAASIVGLALAGGFFLGGAISLIGGVLALFIRPGRRAQLSTPLNA